MSHEMMKQRERRLCLWSNATCAMPLARHCHPAGIKGHITRMDRVGTGEIPHQLIP